MYALLSSSISSTSSALLLLVLLPELVFDSSTFATSIALCFPFALLLLGSATAPEALETLPVLCEVLAMTLCSDAVPVRLKLVDEDAVV